MCRRQQIDLVALIHILLLFVAPSSFAASSWNGAVIDDTGRPVAGAGAEGGGKRGGAQEGGGTLSGWQVLIPRTEGGLFEGKGQACGTERKAAGRAHTNQRGVGG